MTNKFSPNMNEENDLNKETALQQELDLEYDDEENEEFISFSDKFYIQTHNKTCGSKPSALAFTIPDPDNLERVIVKGWTLAWTRPALKDLSAIQKATGTDKRSAVKNLPYVSLRGLMEIGLNNIVRIQSNVGLSKNDLNEKKYQKYPPKPFAYLTDASSEEEIQENLKDILSEWIANYLKPFADKAEVPEEILERLQEMQEKGELITISEIKVRVLPWKSNKTGTAIKSGEYDFGLLADCAARLIAGKEIFTGLGPMKRIISSHSLTSNVAELITDPISIDDESGKFSLLLRLEVITIPYLNQPLLKIDVSKRRWLNDLRKARYNDSQITGFMFPDDYTDRAFTYTVFPQEDQKSSQQVKKSRKKKSQPQETSTEKATYSWVTGKDFEPLREKFRLSTETFNGKQIVAGEASKQKCQVLLTYKNGLQDDHGIQHGIQAGVPEIDKLEAYEKVAEIFESVGLKPFDAYSAIKPKQGKAHSTQKLEDAKASRMINLPTLLQAILLPDGKSSQNIASLSDSELDDLLREKFGTNLEMILGKRKSLEFHSKKPNQADELKLLIAENKAALARLYPQEKLRLMIFCENTNHSDVKLLKAIAHLLYGASLEIEVNHLPENTHGPKINLPGKDLKKAKERSAKRIKAWKHTSKQVANPDYRTFCLVMARDFYEEANKPDDKVNKPSTRKALATYGRSCVQFLRPIKIKTKQLKLEYFFHRVQAALKDLLFAHSGRIDGVQEKVDKYLANTPAEKRPKEIIGITVVRKQSGRVIGKINDTFLPVAIRLKVDTGICEMCCADEKGNKLADIKWRNFSESLAFVATLSPIKLGDKKTKPRLFLEFVEKVISDSVEAEKHPLVMIDSTNVRGLWAWVRDTDINSEQINLDYEIFKSNRQNFRKNMEVNWESARLIRIRQKIAPGMIEKKERWLVETYPEDTRTKAELKNLSASKKIPSATTPTTGLFKITTPNQNGCIVYISIEHKTLETKRKGQSCYREIEVNKDVKKDGKYICNQDGEKLGQLSTSPPTKDQWPTPNPLEIVVTLRQPEDNPDDLAALVESLRYSFGHYSDWTSLPAPLFFARVVRDYISDFHINDDEAEDAPEENEAEDAPEDEKAEDQQLSLPLVLE